MGLQLSAAHEIRLLNFLRPSCCQEPCFQARGRLDPVFKGLLDSTEAQLSNADQWSSRHLVNAAYAVAKLRVTPQDTRAYNAFAQASSQRLQHFNAQDIPNLSP